MIKVKYVGYKVFKKSGCSSCGRGGSMKEEIKRDFLVYFNQTNRRATFFLGQTEQVSEPEFEHLLDLNRRYGDEIFKVAE